MVGRRVLVANDVLLCVPRSANDLCQGVYRGFRIQGFLPGFDDANQISVARPDRRDSIGLAS